MAGEYFVHMGFDRTGLSDASVVDLATGTENLIQGLPLGKSNILAARALEPSGFAIVAGYLEPEDDALYEVDMDGIATYIGNYALPPDHDPRDFVRDRERELEVRTNELPALPGRLEG